jgi:hypothetical protein
MIGSDVVDMVVGILFVFLIFSLVVSGVNEAISRLVGWRSRHLWRALRRLLDGERSELGTDQRPEGADPTSQKWAERLYAHPLILQLEGRIPTARSRLSSIPTEDFSRAILDLLVPDADGPISVDQLRAAIRDLPEGQLKSSLSALLKTAGDSVTNIRQEIGDWFDSRMEALSRSYKRHVKWVLVTVGIGVALAFNVDAIGTANRLYRDEALRTAVADQASAVAAACEGEADISACTRERIGKVDDAIRLPVGWPDPDGITALQVFGWLVAGIGLGQGAPFWFDLLGKAGKLRS